MYNYQNKSSPKCFSDFFAMLSELHSYPIRFALGDNYSVMRVNKAISQCLVHYLEPKLWNKPSIETKNPARNNKTAFIKNVKKFLHLNQMQISCFKIIKFFVFVSALPNIYSCFEHFAMNFPFFKHVAYCIIIK